MNLETQTEETQRQAERICQKMDIEIVDMKKYTPSWQKVSTCKRKRFHKAWPDILTAIIVGLCLAAFFTLRG